MCHYAQYLFLSFDRIPQFVLKCKCFASLKIIICAGRRTPTVLPPSRTFVPEIVMFLSDFKGIFNTFSWICALYLRFLDFLLSWCYHSYTDPQLIPHYHNAHGHLSAFLSAMFYWQYSDHLCR